MAIGKDRYSAVIVEASSPFTKKPSTQFRLSAIGLLKDPFCYEREYTDKVGEDINIPSPLPIQPKPPLRCDLTLAMQEELIEVASGETVKIKLNHGENYGIFDSIGYFLEGQSVTFNTSYNHDDSTLTVTFEGEGQTILTITVNYGEIECEVSIPVVVTPQLQECSVGMEDSNPNIGDITWWDISGDGLEVEFIYDETYLMALDQPGRFIPIREGTTEVTAVVTFEDGQVCEDTAIVTIGEFQNCGLDDLEHTITVGDSFGWAIDDPDAIYDYDSNFLSFDGTYYEGLQPGYTVITGSLPHENLPELTCVSKVYLTILNPDGSLPSGGFPEEPPEEEEDQPVTDPNVTWDGTCGTSKHRVHFSGIALIHSNTPFNVPDTEYSSTQLWQQNDGGFSDLLGVGEYPNIDLAIPNAINQSLDSIVVDACTRLEVWDSPNFTGNKVLDVTGLTYIGNSSNIFSLNLAWSEYATSEHMDMFYSISAVQKEPLLEYTGGSMKISKVN